MATKSLPWPRVDVGDHLQPAAVLEMRSVLEAAFGTPSAMTDLLSGLNQKFIRFHAMNAAFPEAVTAVVQIASQENWWRELLAAARQARPRDPALAAFAEEFDLSPVPIDGNGQRIEPASFEKIVRAGNSMMDVAVWRSRLGEVEACICRVECPPGSPRGTGFLVAPGVVITNYHVVEPLIASKWRRADVALRFDYKVKPDGLSVDAGTVYHLAEDWLIDSSPYSQFDLTANPTGEASPEELDYALLAVAGAPGDVLLGAGTNATSRRGWIKVPPATDVPDFNGEKALFIVQHADGKPMQVAMDTEAIEGVFGNGSRLRYSTNTLPGSSGSPCFSSNWHWVALHHSGDPKYSAPGQPSRYNQGILVSSIVHLLEKRGKLKFLS
ncbi:trypsin-like peptidase domain-containing protein [Roseateles sp.]|uniref:trypsin-like peptidase domain-containing protein n=1 Tax=Roseateles sp. TaxID=1971397 RepID=UPI002F3E6D69